MESAKVDQPPLPFFPGGSCLSGFGSAALVLVKLIVACSRPPESSLKELQKAQVGDLEVVLLSPSASLPQGQGFALLEFRDGHGMLVDVGIVRMSATMPMPGAATMSGSSELKPTPAPGRYEVATDLSMAGAWYFQIDWNGPAGRGSARLESRVK